MAALTASRNTNEWNGTIRKHVGLVGVEASTSLYVGGLVCRNANGNAVKAQALGASPLNKLQILGICEYVYAGGIVPPGIDALNQTGNSTLYPGATATLGTAGAISVGVVTGTFGFDYDSTISSANVGELVFATDDHTMTLGTAVANTTALVIAANTTAAGASVLILNPNIVQGTFVATQNSGGTGTIYAEGTDYDVDYQAGLFIVQAGGALVNLNASIYVSYRWSASVVAGRLIAIDAGQAYVDLTDKFVVM